MSRKESDARREVFEALQSESHKTFNVAKYESPQKNSEECLQTSLPDRLRKRASQENIHIFGLNDQSSIGKAFGAKDEKEIIREEKANLKSQEVRRYRILGWNKDNEDNYGGLPKFYEMEEPGDYLEHKDGHKGFIPANKTSAADEYSKMVQDFAPITPASIPKVKDGHVTVAGWTRSTRDSMESKIRPAPMHVTNNEIDEDVMVDYDDSVPRIVKSTNDRLKDRKIDKKYEINERAIYNIRAGNSGKTRSGWERGDLPAATIDRPIIWQALKD